MGIMLLDTKKMSDIESDDVRAWEENWKLNLSQRLQQTLHFLNVFF